MKEKNIGLKLFISILILTLIIFFFYYIFNSWAIIYKGKQVMLSDLYNKAFVSNDNAYRLIINQEYISYDYLNEDLLFNETSTYQVKEGLIELDNNTDFKFTILNHNQIFSNYHHIYLLNFSNY